MPLGHFTSIIYLHIINSMKRVTMSFFLNIMQSALGIRHFLHCELHQSLI